MKYIFISATILFVINSFGQLDKKTWLVGGTGSFDSYKQEQTFYFQSSQEYNKVSYDVKEFELNPKIGYFIIDKLAIGLSSSFISEKSESKLISGSFGGGYTKSHKFSVGPFVRYYFFKKDKTYNILTEINYQFGNLSQSDLPNSEGKINKLSFFIGPEFFFNSSIGLELLLGYKTLTQKMDNPNNVSIANNGFQVAIGFQIHLEK